MKKILLFLLLSFIATAIYAQDTDNNIYKGLETNKELKLTTEQIAQIKKLNREIGSKFAAIGKNNKLSGKEKGEKKRELALQHKASIMKVLTPEQVSIWEKKYKTTHEGQGIKNAITDNFDERLNKLEDKYKQDELNIENNPSLDKKGKKEAKKILKENYKKEKELLKEQKKAVKQSELLKR